MDQADEIVAHDSGKKFFGHHVAGLAAELLQIQGLLDGTKIGLDVPTAAIEFDDLLEGQVQSSEQVQHEVSPVATNTLDNQSAAHGGVGGDFRMAAAIISARRPSHLIS